MAVLHQDCIIVIALKFNLNQSWMSTVIKNNNYNLKNHHDPSIKMRNRLISNFILEHLNSQFFQTDQILLMK